MCRYKDKCNERTVTCEERFCLIAQQEINKELQKENAELKSRIEKSVKLPCKVGDKIYHVAPFKGKEILIHTVTGFIVAKTVNKILTKVQLGKGMPSSLEPLLIGVNLFLTKEEAEQAVKGGAEKCKL